MAEPFPGSAAEPGGELPRQLLPRSLHDLRVALAAGQREFSGLCLSDFDGVDLDLAGCNLRDGCFLEARFGHARFTGSDLDGCGFQRALLWGADLSTVQARGSFWQEADLSGSRLQGADFSEALLHRACLRGVVAAASLWQGARLVEADFRSGLDQLTDLGRADFQGADLSFAQFHGANLRQACLQEAILYGTDFSGADLREADLRGCDLRHALIASARLEAARLEGARLPEI
jgi:uncharacterized protein YjbI with pentapeptide repeats